MVLKLGGVVLHCTDTKNNWLRVRTQKWAQSKLIFCSPKRKM